jgi:DNA-binding HxlR family transcriptional regulator
MRSDVVGSAPRIDVPNWTSVRTGVDLIASKWALPILAELCTGPKRHNQISRSLAVDNKQLGRALRRLQEAQLVSRQIHEARQQVQVWYQLTGCGRELLPLLTALGKWRDNITPSAVTVESPAVAARHEKSA